MSINIPNEVKQNMSGHYEEHGELSHVIQKLEQSYKDWKTYLEKMNSNPESIHNEKYNLAKLYVLCLRNALQKVEDGTYGTCTDCGKAISANRLRMKPETPRCITCQQRVEEFERNK